MGSSDKEWNWLGPWAKLPARSSGLQPGKWRHVLSPILWWMETAGPMVTRVSKIRSKSRIWYRFKLFWVRLRQLWHLDGDVSGAMNFDEFRWNWGKTEQLWQQRSLFCLAYKLIYTAVFRMAVVPAARQNLHTRTPEQESTAIIQQCFQVM